MVNAPALHRDAIMEALRKGNFYASCGPRFHSIDYDPEEGLVTVKCSKDVQTVIFKSNTPVLSDHAGGPVRQDRADRQAGKKSVVLTVRSGEK